MALDAEEEWTGTLEPVLSSLSSRSEAGGGDFAVVADIATVHVAGGTDNSLVRTSLRG
jgi:hypothetical protein